ncbi:MAG: GtrA family protein [Clostridia bacterium]|nr:GtrA family protein [Clostridia bacterium]
MKNRLKEIIKFAFTGGVCFLIEWLALTVMVEWLTLDVNLATPLAFLISVVINYLLCVRWVFDGAKNGDRKAQMGFIVTSLLGLAINSLVMLVLGLLFDEHAVLLQAFGLTLKVYQVNKVVATLVVMVWNYFTKRWLLKGDAK